MKSFCTTGLVSVRRAWAGQPVARPMPKASEYGTPSLLPLPTLRRRCSQAPATAGYSGDSRTPECSIGSLAADPSNRRPSQPGPRPQSQPLPAGRRRARLRPPSWL